MLKYEISPTSFVKLNYIYIYGETMIGYIDGFIASIAEHSVILDHQGIGFLIEIPVNADTDDLHEGEEIRFYIHMAVREDAIRFYGFRTKDEKEIFELLIGVSGIGPKGALGILSELSADEVRFAILAEDAGTLSRAPGIGKKTAQKLILELKDKFSLEDAFEQKLSPDAGVPSSGDGQKTTARREAAEALVALGYSSSDAMRAIRRADPEGNLETEEILKAALKFMI